MYRKFFFNLCLVLFSVAIVAAEENGSNGPNESKAASASSASDGQNAPNASNGPNAPGTSNGPGESDAKTLRGMSVLGNNEAPMSLFIVPWKSSELGVETSLTRTLNERDVPVDRDVFMRELAFYQVGAASKAAALAAVSQNLKSQ
jgi:hypothetical protein